MSVTLLEEAKQHLATYGAAHTDCCGTPLVRKLVAEVEQLAAALKGAQEDAANGWSMVRQLRGQQ